MLDIPLSLYIHIPWCIKKCPYCDFNSHALNGSLPEQEYMHALLYDLEQDLALAQNRIVNTIFIGGGTPSLLSPKGYAWLFEELAKRLQFANAVEITMEMNPGTVEYHNVADYRAAGITRISLGAQSFNDQKLQALGRIHKSEETKNAIHKIKAAKFNSYNIDLMHGLPQQTVVEAYADLETALSFEPPHISWYQLTLEPNTVFYKYPPKLPDDEITWEIQQRGEELLHHAGFQHYEVSAFARPNQQCQHNINYWRFGDYLGIGAGAHSKITDLHSKLITRSWKTRNPKDYLDPQQNFRGGSAIISSAEIPIEYLLNRLRLFNTIDLHEYTQRTGLPVTDITAILEKAQSKGLVNLQENNATLSNLGKKFLNDILLDAVTN